MFLQVFLTLLLFTALKKVATSRVLNLSTSTSIYHYILRSTRFDIKGRAGDSDKERSHMAQGMREEGRGGPAGARIVLLYQQVKISCYSKDQLSPRNAAYFTCSAQSPQSPSLPTYVLSDNDFKVIQARSVVVKVRPKLRHRARR